MCPDCDRLKKENDQLRLALKQLRLMVHDMGGGKVKFEDDPYEDEAPLVVWEEKE